MSEEAEDPMGRTSLLYVHLLRRSRNKSPQTDDTIIDLCGKKKK